METDHASGATICSATVSDGRLRVSLSDGRDLSTPIEWYPVLAGASVSELEKMEISPFGLHWAELDEDVSLTGMLAGKQSPSNPMSPMSAPIVDLTNFRDQKALMLLADASIDYPEQRDIIGKFAHE